MSGKKEGEGTGRSKETIWLDDDDDSSGLTLLDTQPPSGKQPPEDNTEIMARPSPVRLPGRYSYSSVLGLGGMGRVLRVFDERLQRFVALKVILKELSRQPSSVSRFISEAQVCAQLQHPNIIPVYDMGEFEDGRQFFTMKEVHGLTLGQVIEQVHSTVRGGQWSASANGWNFHRLIDVFARVCDAMAHAHSSNVIHRDLKPENIMVGSFGEVVSVRRLRDLKKDRSYNGQVRAEL